MWIEIPTADRQPSQACVTPLAGVWIEIRSISLLCWALASLPLRECGLKSPIIRTAAGVTAVTPLAGVWIEIQSCRYAYYGRLLSLPLRECGLKYLNSETYANGIPVTPLAGVWIEISCHETIVI